MVADPLGPEFEYEPPPRTFDALFYTRRLRLQQRQSEAYLAYTRARMALEDVLILHYVSDESFP